MGEPGILPDARVSGVIVPARENVIVQRSTPTFERGAHRSPGSLHQLELDRPLNVLLDHDSLVADEPARHDVANPDGSHVAGAQLAVDHEIEERPVAQSPMLVELERDRQDQLLPQPTFCAQQPSSFQRRRS